MIKIAHEAPMSIMSRMQGVTDYDYALACLFDKIPGYYEFFEEALKNGRKVILDNGVFEDGVPMNTDMYAAWIERLKPTEYIVPDEFDKARVTMDNILEWVEKYYDLPGKRIGVVQGTSNADMFDCYQCMANNADKIAINFASVYYQNAAKDLVTTWDQKAVYGRLLFIFTLIATNRYRSDKPHHILGCSLPKEFELLRSIEVLNQPLLSFFESMDTSAPVVWGIMNGRYPEYLGNIRTKNKTKLKDLITADLTDQQTKDIFFNVDLFRSYLT